MRDRGTRLRAHAVAVLGGGAILLAAAALAACGASGAAVSASSSLTPSSVNVSPTPAGAPTPTPLPLPQLSTRQLAGQRVIFGYRGLTPPASLLAKIRAGEVAGVIFFKGNVSNLTQITKVIGELQSAAAQSPAKEPLLLMTDQEGGIVRRLPGAPLLSEKQIGASVHPAVAARQAGHNAGLLLRSVGMNVDLAPVLDVYQRPRGLHRSVRTVLQRRPADRGGAWGSLHHSSTADRRGRHRQALSRPRGGGHGARHRRASGDAERVAGHPAGRR